MKGKKLEPLKGFIDSWTQELDIGCVRFVEFKDKKDTRLALHFYNGNGYDCIEAIKYPGFNNNTLINSLRRIYQ